MSYVLQQKHHSYINYDVNRLANIWVLNSGKIDFSIPKENACQYQPKVVNCSDGMVYDREMGGCWYDCKPVTHSEFKDVRRCGHRILSPSLGYVENK